MSDGAFGALGNIFGSILSTVQASNDNAEQRKLAREKSQRVQNALSNANTEYDKMLSLLENNYDTRTQLSSPELLNNYKELISNYNPEDYTYDFGTFEEQGNFDKTVDDYLNPYYDKIIQATADKVSNSAAGAGLGRSGGTAYDIAEQTAQKSNELYNTALQQYNTDKQLAYKEYSDYINNMQNKYNNLANLTSNKINLMSGAITHDETQDTEYMKDLLSLMSDKASTNVNAQLYS